jgi:hypothetical protein
MTHNPGTVERKRIRPLVDEKCFELAEHFLTVNGPPNEDSVWELAVLLQGVADDFCSDSDQ